MKTQSCISTLFALTLAFAPQCLSTAAAGDSKGGKLDPYAAVLVSPAAGAVLMPGQMVKVEWKSSLPNLDLSYCETEVRLSLDGGQTFTYITGERDPREKFFNWIVPNTPTRAAVLDIHFGCLGRYPETSSIQTESTFVIGDAK
jgi:hypothetical protein